MAKVREAVEALMCAVDLILPDFEYKIGRTYDVKFSTNFSSLIGPDLTHFADGDSGPVVAKFIESRNWKVIGYSIEEYDDYIGIVFKSNLHILTYYYKHEI